MEVCSGVGQRNPTPVPPRAERMKWLEWFFRHCMLWAISKDMQYILWSILECAVSGKWQVKVERTFFLSRLQKNFEVKFLANPSAVPLACRSSLTGCTSHLQQGWAYLHIRVWCTVGRRWKTWLLTARLCSSRKGSRTTPSLTGNVRRSSSLWLAGIEEGEKAWTFPLASAVQ